MSIDKVRESKAFIKRGLSKFKSKRLNFIPLIAFIGTIIIANGSVVFAGGQVQSRSIEMSTSQTGASATYTIQFNVATTGTIQSLVVDFCGGTSDPIPGDTCTIPGGFVAGSTVAVQNTGLNPTSSASWTASTLNSGRTFEFLDASGGSVSSGATITIAVSGFTNPTGTAGTFYARILTFATSSGAGSAAAWQTACPTGNCTTGVIDYGGIALSTVAQITIQSKVQESITFCIYTSAYDSGACTGTGTSVLLGNANDVLSTSSNYADISTKFDIQTNALHNVTIRFTGNTLTSGANVIESSANSGTGSTAATAYASTVGSNQFGLCAWEPTGSTITIANTYNSTFSGGTACSAATTGVGGGGTTIDYGLNLTSANGIASTYGDTLATVTPGTTAEGEIAFLGNISNTQAAGVYTSTLTFIATGQY